MRNSISPVAWMVASRPIAAALMLASAVVGLGMAGCAATFHDTFPASDVDSSASNEIWRVTDLEFHDSAGGGYYTFTFAPRNRNNPADGSAPGTLAAADLVGRAPTSGPGSTEVIIVRHGSISELQPQVDRNDDDDRPRGHGPAAKGLATPIGYLRI